MVIREFFTSLVNVENLLKEIESRLESPKDIRLAKSSLNHLRDYILYVEAHHKTSLHPSETAKLRDISQKIVNIDAILDSPNADAPHDALLLFQQAQRELISMYSLTSVYLLRHPDKSKDMTILPSGKEVTRNLSFKGVRQAKQFAEYLAEEIVLCPKPVHVRLFCSDMRRTWLFAEVIRRKLVQTTAHYHKKITIESHGGNDIIQHPALYFRLTPQGLNEIEQDYNKNEFGTFVKWLDGKYRLLPDPVQVSAELEAWASAATSISSTSAWQVVIGVSHSYIVDTLLYSKTRQHKAIIETAGYARFVQKQMGYRGNWYRYTA